MSAALSAVLACNLEGGIDLSLSEAERWLKDAAANGICQVNLRGIILIFSGDRILGLRPNIAVSGYHFGREEVRRFVQAGIENICVSLNASYEACNALTRDGYDLAIGALQALKEEKFERTCINWVMHSSNAEDFADLIKLAEKYNVSEVDVMVFKPDAKRERNIPATYSADERYGIIYQAVQRTGYNRCRTLLFTNASPFGRKIFFEQEQRHTKRLWCRKRRNIRKCGRKIDSCRHLDVREEELTV